MRKLSAIENALSQRLIAADAKHDEANAKLASEVAVLAGRENEDAQSLRETLEATRRELVLTDDRHTRALAEKFQLLLDLIFRSLHETYIGGPYSADALLKRLQKIDANI